MIYKNVLFLSRRGLGLLGFFMIPGAQASQHHPVPTLHCPSGCSAYLSPLMRASEAQGASIGWKCPVLGEKGGPEASTEGVFMERKTGHLDHLPSPGML